MAGPFTKAALVVHNHLLAAPCAGNKAVQWKFDSSQRRSALLWTRRTPKSLFWLERSGACSRVSCLGVRAAVCCRCILQVPICLRLDDALQATLRTAPLPGAAFDSLHPSVGMQFAMEHGIMLKWLAQSCCHPAAGKALPLCCGCTALPAPAGKYSSDHCRALQLECYGLRARLWTPQYVIAIVAIALYMIPHAVYVRQGAQDLRTMPYGAYRSVSVHQLSDVAEDLAS